MYSKNNSRLILFVVAVSFLISVGVSVGSLRSLAKENTREIDMMLTAHVYNAVSSITRAPITVARTMSADHFLADTLKSESDMSEEEVSVLMKNYLSDIMERMDYDSVFVVSEKTRRYYSYGGLNKVTDTENDPHDIWYSRFVGRNIEYELNVDSDENNGGQMTVFVNARVEDDDGSLLGVCGVGVNMSALRKIITGMENGYNLNISFVDSDGTAQINSGGIDIERSYLTAAKDDSTGYIYSRTDKNEFTVTKYDPYLDWYLVIRSDGTAIKEEFRKVIIFNVVMSLLVAAVILVVLTMILKRSDEKSKANEILNARLSSTSDIYLSLHEIDFISDTFTQVRNSLTDAAEIIGDRHDRAQDMIYEVMDKFTAEGHKQRVHDFVTFSNIDELLKDRRTVTVEFLSAGCEWRRARYIVSERTPDGRVSRAIYLVEDIDAEKRERDTALDTIKTMNEQISSVANIYFVMYDVNIINDTFSELKTSLKKVTDLVGETTDNAQEVIFRVTDQMTHESSKETIHNFIDFSTLDKRMKRSDTITEEFLGSRGIWCRARFIVSKRTSDGKISHVLWLIESIDEEKRRRDLLFEVTETLNQRISSIVNIYMTVFEFDMASDTFAEIKTENKAVTDIIRDTDSGSQETLFRVMQSVTDESCINDVMRFVDMSDIEDRLFNTETVTIEYMNKQKQWRRGRFIVSKRDQYGALERILWVVEDIDNEKKERDKFRDISERAVAASEAKSSFLSNMSHEIRTPINAVLGMNEMILRECDDSNILAYSESIRTAGNTLLGLINDILDFSKIEAGKMEIIPVDYDLSSVINDLVNMVHTRADEKGLRIVTNFDRNIPKILNGDEVRIKQIVTNILTNAVKYTERGSITFRIKYEKLPDEPDSVLLNVAVKDTGIGIKPEDMKKLFSEFERIEEKRNRKVEGTGLGMNITKRLLEMMGSSLKVESVYGLGSKFSFSLKQKVIKWEPLGDYEAAYKALLGKREKYHEKFTAPDACVLVVDDTPMNLMVFKSLLKQTGVKIDTAESGDEGIKLSAKKKYDIIFLDHMMPDKDGIETLHELRSKKNDPNIKTPVICLTANAISGAREKYLSEGFDDYLTKPIDSAKLEDMLIKYLSDEKINPADENTDISAGAKNSVLPAFVRDISELDIKSGIKNNADEESYLEMLKTYVENVGRLIEDIENLMADGDIKNAAIKIHALKSTSRIIGASDIGELAQRLENAGNSGDTETLENELGGLLERCRDLIKQLAPLIEKEEKSDLPPIDENDLQEAFTLINEYCFVNDIESIIGVINDLGGYDIPEEYKEKFDALKEAADNFDYDLIPDILQSGSKEKSDETIDALMKIMDSMIDSAENEDDNTDSQEDEE